MRRPVFVLKRAEFIAFDPVGGEKSGVAGEVVGPIAGDAAETLAAQGVAEAGDKALASGKTAVGDLGGPKRDEPHQIIGGARRLVGGWPWDGPRPQGWSRR